MIVNFEWRSKAMRAMVDLDRQLLNWGAFLRSCPLFSSSTRSPQNTWRWFIVWKSYLNSNNAGRMHVYFFLKVICSSSVIVRVIFSPTIWLHPRSVPFINESYVYMGLMEHHRSISMTIPIWSVPVVVMVISIRFPSILSNVNWTIKRRWRSLRISPG